jgi:SWI/SNF related-matrix-associated actin-dependent regulator of chromatin subfamily C
MTTPKNSNDDARGSKSSGSKKKSGNKKSGSTNKGGILSTSNHNNDESNEPVPLVRVSASNRPHSINPRGILTGFYSKNGKRMQHIVHCGALQMPKESADVIEKFTKLAGMEPASKYDLPGLDSVVRPCTDPKMKNIIVTELMIEKVNTPQQVEPPKLTPEQVAAGMVQEAPKIIMVKTSRSAAKNRFIRRVPTNKAVLKSNLLGAERIRGGGDDFGTTSEEQQQQQQQQTDQVVNMDIDETSESIAGIETTQSPAIAGGQMASTSNVTESTTFNVSSASTTQDPSATAEAPSIDNNTNDIPKSSGEETAMAVPQMQPSIKDHNDQKPTSSDDASPVDMDTTAAAVPTSTESGQQLSMNTIENESAIADESLKVRVAASTVTVDKAVESGNDTTKNDSATQEQANPQSANTTMITGDSNMAAENITSTTATPVNSIPTNNTIAGTTAAANSDNDPSAGNDISSLQASSTTMNIGESKKDAENINTSATATSVTSIPTTSTIAPTTTTAVSTHAPSAGKDISSLQASNTTMKTGESKKDTENNTAAVATSVTSIPTTSTIAPTTTTTVISTHAPSAGKDISSLQASNTTMKTGESKKDTENNTAAVATSVTSTASTVAVTNSGTNATSTGKDLSSLRASNTNNIVKADESNKVTEIDTNTAAASITSTTDTTSTIAVTTTAPSGGKDLSSLRASTTIAKAEESNKVTQNDTYMAAASTTNTTSTVAGTTVAAKAPSGGKDISFLRAFTTAIANDTSIASTPNTASTVAGTTTTTNAPTGGKDISVLRASTSVASIDKIPSSTLSSDATGAADVPKSTSVAPVATKPIKTEEKKAAEVLVPQVNSLTSKPAPQWEQHRPTPNDETITTADQLPPKPEWYKRAGIDEIERTMLPEWFNSSAPHRTPETFLKSREKIIEMSEALANRNVTNAMIRRTVLGDAGSLHRLRSFLVRWGVINKDGINDSAPTPASLRPDLKRSAEFNDDIKDNLIVAVTQQAKKRRIKNDHNDDVNVVPSSVSSFDWEEVAVVVGHGVSAEDCQRNFMMTPLSEESSSTSNVTQEIDGVASAKIELNQSKGASQKDFIRNLVQSSDPEVRKKMFDAAMEATCGDVVESQSASLLGLHTTKALEDSRGHEIDLAVRLSKLMDARMQKLENRMAMMDDVEAILEAEKMALEMERRDLYTARCRHWFGGV